MTALATLHLYEISTSLPATPRAPVSALGPNLLQPLVNESGQRRCPWHRLTAGRPGAQRVRASPAPAALHREIGRLTGVTLRGLAL